MLTLEVRYDDGVVKIRKFGNRDFKRWTILKPGDKDHVTGWSFDRLRGLGEGIWEFSSCVPATANA
jgi:hypothetical protein